MQIQLQQAPLTLASRSPKKRKRKSNPKVQKKVRLIAGRPRSSQSKSSKNNRSNKKVKSRNKTHQRKQPVPIYTSCQRLISVWAKSYGSRRIPTVRNFTTRRSISATEKFARSRVVCKKTFQSRACRISCVLSLLTCEHVLWRVGTRMVWFSAARRQIAPS